MYHIQEVMHCYRLIFKQLNNMSYNILYNTFRGNKLYIHNISQPSICPACLFARLSGWVAVSSYYQRLFFKLLTMRSLSKYYVQISTEITIHLPKYCERNVLLVHFACLQKSVSCTNIVRHWNVVYF